MKFGIEIEVNMNPGMDRHTLAALISAAGIPCVAEGYNHTTRRHWKIVTDATLSGGRLQGAEIVSPILYGQAGLDALKIVCEALDANVTVDMSCGLHVHHDAGNHDADAFKRLVKIFLKAEKSMDSVQPRSRKNSRWCAALAQTPSQFNDMWNRLDEIISTRAAAHFFGSTESARYRKLNFRSLLTHGTVEFRQHAGTTDFAKISNWVLLTSNLMERAKAGNVIKKNMADEMAYLTHGVSRETRKFFKNRAKHFAS